MAIKESFDEVSGDGGSGPISEPTLTELKSEVDSIVSEAKEFIYAVRLDSQDTRFCRWDGQAPDGLKHEDYLQDVPEPFEGASDMRVRIADMLVNEEVMLLTVAAMRAQIRVSGIEASDTERAGSMTLALRWILRNYLGAKWVEEVIRLANYYAGDCPGLALMGVSWRKEQALRLENMTSAQLMDLYLQRLEEAAAESADPAALQTQGTQAIDDFKAALSDKGIGNEVLSDLLLDFFPDVRPARAKKVIAELRKTGKAQFPVSYTKRNGPDVQAKRLFEDWYAPLNTEDFQTARIWFEPRWLSKTAVHERAIAEEWDKTFLEDVLKHEGVAAFPDFIRDASGNLQSRTKDWYRGMYQVVTAYYLAINEDGIPGRYFVTFHKEVTNAAHERRLLDYAHGKYPGHVFRREVLNRRMMDSRGIPEVAGVYQGLMKLFSDSFGDHAQIAGVPPIITHGRQRMGTLRIKPLAELQAKRDGDYKWMQPPAYPATVMNMMGEISRQMNEYYGRPTKESSPELVALQRDFKVMWWLTNLREVLVQIMQLFQQYADDDMLSRITNRKGETLIKSVDEIQGQFDLDLVFDPRDLDLKNLKEIGTIVRDMLMSMDRDKTINPTAVVAALLWRVSPDLAEASLRPVDQANADETQDELRKYQEIRGGVEPELLDDGSINYQLRLDLYKNMRQMNPNVFGDMAEDKVAILTSRIQRLTVLAQQYGENVTIGRQGGRAALPAAQTTEAPATDSMPGMPEGGVM